MSKISRRQWLELSALSGAALTLNPIDVLANPHYDEWHAITDSGMAKLNSNENPFGPSDKVRKAMIEAFDLGCRYPYQKMNDLAQMIAKKEGVSRDHIVMAAGSTEGLRSAGVTYGIDGGEILAADPVFKALLVYAKQYGATINKVPLNEDLGHDLEEMERRVSNKTSLIFLCNPNNPTGTLIPKDQLVDFCNSVSDKAVVFSDEAYYDYIRDTSYPSMLQLVKKGKNVIVSRTFSKVYGLAGLRCGYLIARPDIAARIRKNMMAQANMMAVIAAMTAMAEEPFYNKSLMLNEEAKTYIYATLNKLGLRYAPSHTNFVFFHTGRDIHGLISKMRDRGVQIGRPFPPLTDWCRISTGTLKDVKKFGKALKEVLS